MEKIMKEMKLPKTLYESFGFAETKHNEDEITMELLL